jgi:SAM-dependent methyltransferase
MESQDAVRLAAEYWTRISSASPKHKRRWWQSPGCRRYINDLIEGVPLADLHGGFHRLISKRAGGKIVRRAVSVGCGSGEKEIKLLTMGLVGSFDLYEITPLRIEMGLQRARETGVEDRVTFHQADAFRECKAVDYDLVYWNNALHHMLDADAAIAWSLERLVPGGMFAMDDFVGPSRFQWTDRNLEYASRFRKSLPEEYLRHPDGPPRVIPTEIARPSIEGMIRMDPTEAADSSAILPAIRRRLPQAEIIPTGGCIYSLAFNDVLANFTEIEDRAIMNAGLLVDRALIELGDTHYAVAVGRK